MGDNVKPIREPRGSPQAAARCTELAARLGVKPCSRSTAHMTMSGSHGEHYDFVELCHAMIDRLDATKL